MLGDDDVARKMGESLLSSKQLKGGGRQLVGSCQV